VTSWAAWSPGLETREAWRRWCASPRPLESEGKPEVAFLPAGVRRRCTRLSKMMLRAAFDCCGEGLRSELRTVFASRHGAIHVAVGIVENIVRGDPVSPMQFSHSVHNAQAGLYSIAGGNRQASSALAGEEDTFPSALVEALLHLERCPDRPVLVVTGDEPLPHTLAHLVDEPRAAYALALLVEAPRSDGAPGDALQLELLDEAPPDGRRDWPQALEFLRWWESGAGELRLGVKRCYRLARPWPARR